MSLMKSDLSISSCLRSTVVSKEPESMLAHMFREKGKIIVHVHSLTDLGIVCFASSSDCESV